MKCSNNTPIRNRIVKLALMSEMLISVLAASESPHLEHNVSAGWFLDAVNWLFDKVPFGNWIWPIRAAQSSINSLKGDGLNQVDERRGNPAGSVATRLPEPVRESQENLNVLTLSNQLVDDPSHDVRDEKSPESPPVAVPIGVDDGTGPIPYWRRFVRKKVPYDLTDNEEINQEYKREMERILQIIASQEPVVTREELILEYKKLLERVLKFREEPIDELALQHEAETLGRWAAMDYWEERPRLIKWIWLMIRTIPENILSIMPARGEDFWTNLRRDLDFTMTTFEKIDFILGDLLENDKFHNDFCQLEWESSSPLEMMRYTEAEDSWSLFKQWAGHREEPQ